MHFLWWVLTIIFFISAFVGLVKIINHEIYKRQFSIILFGVSLIGIIVFYSQATHSQEMSKVEQQKAFKTYLAKIYQKEKLANDANNTFQSKFQQEINGIEGINIVDSLAKSLVDEYQHLHLDFGDMSAPKGFPSDISQMMDKATQELSTAFSVRKEGMNSFLQYLDYQKPSDFQTYKEKMNKANNYISDASKKLLAAQKKINAEK